MTWSKSAIQIQNLVYMTVLNKIIKLHKPSKIAFFILKILIGITLLYFIISKIIEVVKNPDIQSITLSNHWLVYFSITLCLTLLNWAIEAKKWQILVRSTQTLSFKQAYGSVLAGLSTGLVTPNRIGNFIGRNVYLNKTEKVQGIYKTQLGNLAQFLTSMLLGVIGFAIALRLFHVNINPILILVFATAIFSFGLLIYFKPISLLKLPFGQKLYEKDKHNIDQIIAISPFIKLEVIGLSFLRYSVFIIQYYLLFRAVEVNLYWPILPVLISTTFLVTTLIPSLLFGKLLVRESSALLVFGWASISISNILIVSFSLWFINLAIPGLIGLIIWLKKSKW